MTEQEAIEGLKKLYPKTCKMVDGRYKGGFDDRDCVGGQAIDMAINALEEIQQYKALGVTPEMIAKVINFLGNDENSSIINDLELLNQYRFLGTVEELKEAKEKQIAKKPNLEGDGYDSYGNLVYDTWICPNCETHYEVDYDNYDYCPKCGQKLDWGNEDAE